MNQKFAINGLYALFIVGTIAYLWFDWHARHEQFQLILSLAILLFAVLLGRIPDDERVRVLLTCLAGFAAIRLIVWRIFCALNLTSPFNAVASVALLLGELYAVVGFVLMAIQNCYLHRRARLEPDPSYQPFVDIFICTYNEPLEIVRRTICGAKYVDYANKNIYLLDDGRREFMLNLALSMGINYVTRPDNKYAKAGNINNALSETTGEFVLILDADHIPCKTILQRTIPYFKDEKVGFVQTPHRFMNAAPVQRNLRLEGKLPHEQELFFQISMVGKDNWNAAIFAGSAGVIRRSVLEEIGGMSRGTVIEDCEFSLDVHRRGYRSVYISDPQSIGMSPETLAAYLIQQSRWARGQTQLLAMANPLFVKGSLTVQQRMCYLANNMYYLFGIPRLIYFIVPVLFLLFGVCPTSVSWLQYGLIALPFLITWLIEQSYIYKNYRHSFWSDVFETVLAPSATLWTTATLLDPETPRFAVTPKGLKTKTFFLDLRMVFGNVVLWLICVFAFVIGVIKLLLQFDPVGNFANCILDAYNIMVLSCAVMVGCERPQVRRVHRVTRTIPISVQAPERFEGIIGGTTVDVSEFGARIKILTPQGLLRKEDQLNISIEADDGTLIDVLARIVRVRPDSEFTILECEFLNNTDEQIERLICAAYCSPNYWASLIEPQDSILRSLVDMLETPIRVMGEIRRNIVRSGLAIVVPTEIFQNKLVPERLKSLMIEAKSEPASTTEQSAFPSALVTSSFFDLPDDEDLS